MRFRGAPRQNIHRLSTGTYRACVRAYIHARVYARFIAWRVTQVCVRCEKCTREREWYWPSQPITVNVSRGTLSVRILIKTYNIVIRLIVLDITSLVWKNASSRSGVSKRIVVRLIKVLKGGWFETHEQRITHHSHLTIGIIPWKLIRKKRRFVHPRTWNWRVP